MKVIATLLATSAVLASATDATKGEKDASFFQGLENGFFMRNDEEGYKKYDCPVLVPDQNMQNRFN